VVSLILVRVIVGRSCHATEVPSPYVINVAVMVVINSVIRSFLCIYPDFIRQIGMAPFYSCIHDADNYCIASFGNSPCKLGLYGRKAPLLAVAGVVWHCAGFVYKVGFCPEDFTCGFDFLCHIPGINVRAVLNCNYIFQNASLIGKCT
jgi:hypothetical protein